jgi:hypothetical protein
LWENHFDGPFFIANLQWKKKRGGSSGSLQVEAVLMSGNSTDQERVIYMGKPTRPDAWEV